MTQNNAVLDNGEGSDGHSETDVSANKDIHVLVVDDDRILRMMMQAHVEELGYRVTTAVDGKEAYDMLVEQKDHIDILLLDREMPNMTGMEVVAKMKADNDLKRIPIIMATGSTRPEQIKEGIDAGVFYYLTKPFEQEVLKSVFLSAVRELETQSILKEELKKHKSSFNLIDTAIFNVRTIGEAEDLAAFLANCYPDPERVISGLAELIINAIEHGNLGITYDEKSNLAERHMWLKEIESRLALPENAEKIVKVTFRRNDDGLYCKIEDQGEGFDWKRYLEVDPSRAMDNHGRGIAQARAVSFDEVRFNTAGNVVTAIVTEDDLEW